VLAIAALRPSAWQLQRSPTRFDGTLGLGKLPRLERVEPRNRLEQKRAGEFVHLDRKKLGWIAGAGHRP
jgi:hypothetical protein